MTLATSALALPERFCEPEGFALLASFGIPYAPTLVVTDITRVTADDLAPLGPGRVVVKIADARVAHRSDRGGVVITDAHLEAVKRAGDEIARRFAEVSPTRFVISAFVPHAHELLVGIRRTQDFGAVVTIATGGIHAETWAKAMRPECATAIVAASETSRDAVASALRALPVVRFLTEPQRGAAATTSLDAIVTTVMSMQALARERDDITDFEVNPFAVTPSGLVALDVLGRTRVDATPGEAPRPTEKLVHLLRPRTVGIVGVSSGMNVGRIILQNMLGAGFASDAITVIKPGTDRIDGCRCVPSAADLAAPVDLLVVAVAAAQVPQTIEQVLEHRAAETIIVIPGGLEEKAGSDALVTTMRAHLRASRGTEWRGPLINGGNCLGVRSRPGHIDTLFIPHEKLPVPTGPESPLAIVSQSGAFAIARLSKLASLNPRYVVTLGNQSDLTIGDYLHGLADDRSVRVFAVYVEGFRPGDGARTCQAIARIRQSGRRVIVYRAGRTAAGAQASASHTASLAGDALVSQQLLARAGATMADTIDDFDDLIALALACDGRALNRAIAVVSNAGFECVAAGDHLGALSLAAFGRETQQRLSALFAAARLDGLVDVHNPLDLTPMAGDEAFVAAVEAVAADPGVGAVVVGLVPLTAALCTLPSADPQTDLGAAHGIAQRLSRLVRKVPLPLVVAIDSGALYDPLAKFLTESGVPVVRSLDRAVRGLDRLTA
ncbi:MAG: acetate--CoA ligase family protein [Acidobacteria bacterium]|nr:acetate--CoA ligase family protein [Acidobacteriota bacterium]